MRPRGPPGATWGKEDAQEAAEAAAEEDAGVGAAEPQTSIGNPIGENSPPIGGVIFSKQVDAALPLPAPLPTPLPKPTSTLMAVRWSLTPRATRFDEEGEVTPAEIGRW